MAASPSVGIRLGLEGKEDVKAGLAEIATSGSASAKRLATDFDRAGEDIDKALARRDAAAAKIAALAPATYRSVVDRNVGVSGGSATDNGATYARLTAELMRQEAAAERLREAMDPLYAATKRYEREVAALEILHRAGAITEEGFARATKFAADQMRVGANSAGAQRAGLQQLGYQFGDLSTQVAGGTSFIRAFAQQSGQTLGAIMLLAGESSKLGAVLGGPVGIGLQIAIPLLAALAGKAFEASDAHKEHAKAARDDVDAIDALNKITGVMNRTHEQETGLAIAAARSELVGAQATREKTRALLEQALAQERVKSSAGQSGMADRGDLGAIGAGVAANRVQQLTTALADADAAADKTGQRLQAAFRGAVGDGIKRRVEESFDPAAAATQRYADRVQVLQQRFAAGKITAGQLRDAIHGETVARDNVTEAAARERDATKSASEAKRDAAKAAREQAKDERELTATLAQIVAAFDPVLSAWDEYQKRLADIDKLEAAHKIDAITAATYRQKAALDEIERAQVATAAASQKAFAAIFGANYVVEKWAPDKLSTAGLEKGIDTLIGKIPEVGGAFEALKPISERALDNIADPTRWKTMGSAAKSVIAEIESALIKLAVINPLKNMLFGGKENTLSSLLGGGSLLGKLFGGASAGLSSPGLNLGSFAGTLATPSPTFSLAAIPGFASGTEYASGGMAYVGENGAELVNLPRGARVSSASETRRLLAPANDGGGRIVHNHFSGNLLTPEWWAQIQSGDDHAAMRGTAGGAKLAGSTAARRQRRIMGGGRR